MHEPVVSCICGADSGTIRGAAAPSYPTHMPVQAVGPGPETQRLGGARRISVLAPDGRGWDAATVVARTPVITVQPLWTPPPWRAHSVTASEVCWRGVALGERDSSDEVMPSAETAAALRQGGGGMSFMHALPEAGDGGVRVGPLVATPTYCTVRGTAPSLSYAPTSGPSSAEVEHVGAARDVRHPLLHRPQLHMAVGAMCPRIAAPPAFTAPPWHSHLLSLGKRLAGLGRINLPPWQQHTRREGESMCPKQNGGAGGDGMQARHRSSNIAQPRHAPVGQFVQGAHVRHCTEGRGPIDTADAGHGARLAGVAAAPLPKTGSSAMMREQWSITARTSSARSPAMMDDGDKAVPHPTLWLDLPQGAGAGSPGNGELKAWIGAMPPPVLWLGGQQEVASKGFVDIAAVQPSAGDICAGNGVKLADVERPDAEVSATWDRDAHTRVSRSAGQEDEHHSAGTSFSQAAPGEASPAKVSFAFARKMGERASEMDQLQAQAATDENVSGQGCGAAHAFRQPNQWIYSTETSRESNCSVTAPDASIGGKRSATGPWLPSSPPQRQSGALVAWPPTSSHVRTPHVPAQPRQPPGETRRPGVDHSTAGAEPSVHMHGEAHAAHKATRAPDSGCSTSAASPAPVEVADAVQSRQRRRQANVSAQDRTEWLQSAQHMVVMGATMGRAFKALLQEVRRWLRRMLLAVLGGLGVARSARPQEQPQLATPVRLFDSLSWTLDERAAAHVWPRTF
jgi:hypothetical protein